MNSSSNLPPKSDRPRRVLCSRAYFRAAQTVFRVLHVTPEVDRILLSFQILATPTPPLLLPSSIHFWNKKMTPKVSHNCVEDCVDEVGPSHKCKFVMMQRSHSLQSALKPPGQKRRISKTVRFADFEGSELVRVRHLSENDEPSTSAGEEPLPSHDIRVSLHSFSSRGLFVKGTVRIVNPRYGGRRCSPNGEQVFLSFSNDNWASFRNVVAYKVNSTVNNLYTLWQFSTYLRDAQQSPLCLFKINYFFAGRIVVDNNDGTFYQLQIDPPRPLRSQSSPISRPQVPDQILSDLLSLRHILIQ
ncbi:hypothetical protein L596_018184 [Steinernema carpocapsae]|uniref:CBM21 domain-containing protein n=1 Tax=Steinernema carpocapsae TaxID=34508 RepID=A0A4U5N4D3_STECR|nr:hypothetical protein L596_018184 [Steinernema carpocapsae]